MHNDLKLFKWAIIMLLLPLALAFCGADKFRYPCQDPKNWDKDFCKMPICDVTRTCPEHIFKGQRDPRLGPPSTRVEPMATSQCIPSTQGANCGK
jgi:hypothetical protein